MNSSDQPLTREEMEKSVNDFFATIGHITWFASNIENKLHDCIRIALGADFKKTMIVLPISDIRKKIKILGDLLKENKYPSDKCERIIKKWNKIYKLFAQRNDIIHAPWIGVFVNPDGTPKGIQHDRTSPQPNHFPETHISELLQLRSKFATAYADVIIIWDELRHEFSP